VGRSSEARMIAVQVTLTSKVELSTWVGDLSRIVGTLVANPSFSELEHVGLLRSIVFRAMTTLE
jgi:hypothetical protein